MRTPRLLILALLCPLACVDPGAGETDGSASVSTSGAQGTDGTGGTGSTGQAPTTGGPDSGETGDTGDTGWTPASCYDGWDDIKASYPEAGALQDCADVPGGYAVVRSLLVVDGITIDNNGASMQPCVEARCDADYAYIASNDLPHYDYVQTTPNALVEAPSLFRLALAPTRPGAGVSADPTSVQSSCADAYDQYLGAPDQATPTEPSSLCSTAMGGATEHLRETLASGETATYAKIQCLGSTGVTISGVSVNGPNEAGMPDPFGNPLFSMPDVAGEPYLPDNLAQGAALDLCGGHSGGTMHYHGFNEACFAQAPDGTPDNSYAVASQAWDLPKMLTGACDEPSAIVGWSLDGYPIQGPCVCTARDGDTCTEVKRVRSAWVYDGLGGWGDDPDEAADLGLDGVACGDDDTCCPDGTNGCNFRCAPVLLADDGPDGSVVEHRCALLDYSWCTHRFVDRSLHAGGDFVYLDRCNGYEGPDGYAYHATASFPYVSACYRGTPTYAAGGMMMGGGGMDPPKCQPGQMMCCGDNICGGPETAMNCAEDCG